MGYNNNYQQYQQKTGRYESPQAIPKPVEFKLKENGKIPVDLFDKTAKSIAESFVREDKGQVSARQMRRYFDEVKRYKRIITDEKSWEEQKPYVKMIKSKVAYSIKRAIDRNKGNKGKKGCYENVQKFIFSGIDQIDTKETYHIFVSLFESVYGYYYSMNPDEYDK